MNNFEIENILDSFSVLVDTREQPTERALKRYARFGVPYQKATFSYGDYTFQCEIDGTPLMNVSDTIFPLCAIERKMNLDELAMCFTKDRKRFQAEFERAKEHNARIYLLVENATWENLLNGKYRSKLNPKAFVASVLAWQSRYDMKLIFCKEETSGQLIKEILYRELKERLNNGLDKTRSETS